MLTYVFDWHQEGMLSGAPRLRATQALGGVPPPPGPGKGNSRGREGIGVYPTPPLSHKPSASARHGRRSVPIDKRSIGAKHGGFTTQRRFPEKIVVGICRSMATEQDLSRILVHHKRECPGSPPNITLVRDQEGKLRGLVLFRRSDQRRRGGIQRK